MPPPLCEPPELRCSRRCDSPELRCSRRSSHTAPVPFLLLQSGNLLLRAWAPLPDPLANCACLRVLCFGLLCATPPTLVRAIMSLATRATLHDIIGLQFDPRRLHLGSNQKFRKQKVCVSACVRDRVRVCVCVCVCVHVHACAYTCACVMCMFVRVVSNGFLFACACMCVHVRMCNVHVCACCVKRFSVRMCVHVRARAHV